MNRARQSISDSQRWPAATASILAIFMIGLWGHLLGLGPLSAGAAPQRAVKSNNIQTATAPANPGATSELQAWLTEKKPALQRNVFAVDFSKFPTQGGTHLTDLQAVGDQLTKSASLRADQSKERQTLVDHLREQAVTLHVQSTVLGTSPTAMVNGVAVNEGDHIGPWRVVKIEPAGIVVEQDGAVLEISANDR